MPKKSQDVQSESVSREAVSDAAPAPKAPRPRKKTATAKKKAAKKKARPRAPRKKPVETANASAPTEPTDEQIRMRAYFLGERRAQLSLAGDSDHDWLEARRQLFAEAGLSLE